MIEELWKSLEADALAGRAGRSGWLIRLAHPAVKCPLLAGLELTSRRRAVLLRLPRRAVPSRRKWPRSKGLEPLAIVIDGREHFGVALKEPRFADVFSALAEDLLRRVTSAGTPDEQALAFLGQLGRWQKFLSASLDGLGDEAQRGLWGELRLLREQLFPALGHHAVMAWKGGERAQQDFQFERAAVEVKTTLAKQPQVVRITSERQLDDTNWPALFLSVIALDVREQGGETLVALIASLRQKLESEPAAHEHFEDGLLASGYLDSHESKYIGRGYLIRSQNYFRVKRGFPRLVERDVLDGIGDVNYGLAIAACAKFKVSSNEMVATLASRKPQRRKERGRTCG